MKPIITSITVLVLALSANAQNNMGQEIPSKPGEPKKPVLELPIQEHLARPEDFGYAPLSFELSQKNGKRKGKDGYRPGVRLDQDYRTSSNYC